MSDQAEHRDILESQRSEDRPHFKSLKKATIQTLPQSQIADPSPLGLSAFALTTFILSLINLGTRELDQPNIVVGAAFAYGGLVQLLAGMWEMAKGNCFDATAFSSFSGFWIGTAMIFTPGGFAIVETLSQDSSSPFYNSIGIYFMGWFIFTFILVIRSLRSTLASLVPFSSLDLTFLLLGIAYLSGDGHTNPNTACLRAGGAFGTMSAFAAWYIAAAGLLDSSKSYFRLPLCPLP
ncbi:hypothetical protein D6D01_07182 [Aureobasidium pullulans]|uniref:GPR1/FUN34/yaaH family-domain-containing protein n=1 Tax=Aureobasidium pullulans TaxID=5580 RepID=A0A4V4JTT0_AURPU|nr:hypothetical protein D6D01_07182 [Aureobasidium pullulans]